MSLILGWLTSKVAGPIAGAVALLFFGLFLWQTAQIDGWPLVGGGYRQKVSELTGKIKDLQIASQKALQMAQEARTRAQKAADAEAGAYARGLEEGQSRTQTIIRKVPVYVTEKSNSACIVPLGAVRLLDAAISGSDPGAVEAAIAPGQPNDASSGIALSDVVALLASDFGDARANANQLTHLQLAIRAAAEKE